MPASARVSASMVAAMQAFDAAVALGSFKAAAAALHLTPSAVSHRVRRLESVLGSRLFERSFRRVKPTPAGEALSAMTSRGFAELARAMDRGAETPHANALTISVFPLFASAWLVPRMADFIAKHPEIELSINPSTRLVDLNSEAIDAVVRSGSGKWPGLTAIRLMPLQTVLLAAPSTLARLGLREVVNLSSAPLIQMTAFPGAWPDWFAGQGLKWTKPRQTVWVEGFEAALLAAERGVGVALSLWPLCVPSIEAGHLVEVLPVRVEASTCWLVHRPSDATHPPLTVFKRWLKAELSTRAAMSPVSQPRRVRTGP
jgi:DNA-binding transcriptional LysR family regulator